MTKELEKQRKQTQKAKSIEIESLILEKEKETPKEFANALQEALTELQREPHQRIIKRTSETILELLSHTLVLGLSLGSIWIVHMILDRLLGHDAKFFDTFPVRWIIDVADIVIIGKFLWEVAREFTDDSRRIT